MWAWEGGEKNLQGWSSDKFAMSHQLVVGWYNPQYSHPVHTLWLVWEIRDGGAEERHNGCAWRPVGGRGQGEASRHTRTGGGRRGKVSGTPIIYTRVSPSCHENSDPPTYHWEVVVLSLSCLCTGREQRRAYCQGGITGLWFSSAA